MMQALRHVLALILSVLSVCVCAQSPIVKHLEQDIDGKGKVTIQQDPKLDEWLREGAVVNSHSNLENPAEEIGISSAGNSNSKRITSKSGFRVQIYSGGATREARQAAEAAAEKARRLMPELATYSMFVSPRWLCVVGDFLTRTEAMEMREKLQKSGLTNLTIVRSQVVVQGE